MRIAGMAMRVPTKAMIENPMRATHISLETHVSAN